MRLKHLLHTLAFSSLAIGGLSLSGCGTADVSAGTADTTADPLIRVLLGQGLTEAAIGSGGPVIIDGIEGRGAVRATFPPGLVRLTRDAAGWRIGDGRFEGDVLTIGAEDGGVMKFGDRAYRGKLRLISRGSGNFDVVNDLGVEDYLAGVLPGEIPGHWSEASHEAQAVVARTYALYEVKTAGDARGFFDVYDDTRSQVYGGALAETDRGRRAVMRTSGEVVTHETDEGPRIFKAYFHSTSGGVTLDGQLIFGEKETPALSAQSLGDFGRASKRFNWDPIVLKKDELTRRIRLWGERNGHEIRRMSKLNQLNVLSRNAFGRPTQYEVIDAVGRKFPLNPEEIRWSINTDASAGSTVYSGWFRPINNADNVVLADGHGWGHGVGMCQWSAEGMAKAGADYTNIVTRSYPETRIYRAY